MAALRAPNGSPLFLVNVASRGADKRLRNKQGKTAGDLTSLTARREKLAAR
jgi:hypothetical protein